MPDGKRGYDYRRWSTKLGTWVPLDSEENCPSFELEIKVTPFEDLRKMVMNANGTLKDVRESHEFLDKTISAYRFRIDRAPIRSKAKKTTSYITYLPPKIVSFGPSAFRSN